MTTVQASAAVTAPGFLERHSFLIRRLHSLSGIVPIGVFLIAHLTTNSSMAWGKFGLRGEHPELGVQGGGAFYFQKEVAWINNEVPHLALIEIVLWSAIAFHSIFGVMYAMQGKNNLSRYSYQGNWRYALQRLSGYIGIFFIFYHIATLRWGWNFLVPGGTIWSHNFSVSTLTMALRGGDNFTAWGVAVSLFYFVGITMLVYHFANGLWTAAITWGITISAKSQKRWGVVCLALGAGLMLAAWSSLFAALAIDPAESRKVEELYQQGKAGAMTQPMGSAETASGVLALHNAR